jgi:hypothetical protein
MARGLGIDRGADRRKLAVRPDRFDDPGVGGGCPDGQTLRQQQAFQRIVTGKTRSLSRAQAARVAASRASSRSARRICPQGERGALVLRGAQWWIQIPAPETKTREPIELPWPELLIGSLET